MDGSTDSREKCRGIKNLRIFSKKKKKEKIKKEKIRGTISTRVDFI